MVDHVNSVHVPLSDSDSNTVGITLDVCGVLVIKCCYFSMSFNDSLFVALVVSFLIAMHTDNRL